MVGDDLAERSDCPGEGDRRENLNVFEKRFPRFCARRNFICSAAREEEAQSQKEKRGGEG